ncbi:MAG: dTDP-glucose 4,6-dehydratase [Bacteroidota bacterium]|nr:dTDP-glucose 4,6-dehydratase [Bacteroidota bacterium]MDP4229583.1 dTDP-glucose 4,6-dehydratase [Bacteroidota bacterium]MDP4236978.1 dTDP-glucose 4,6-dehydratase [Bacteroidota bacterium]
MNLFITGGAGFIGSNFVRMAIGRGHNVLNFDALTYAGRRENLSDLENDPRYFFIKGNICNEKEVASALTHRFEGKGFDVVINFAAESHVDRSIEAARIFSETNVVGTATLLETARAKNVPMFVQISTDEVYGSLGSAGKFERHSPLNPSSPYSASKSGADLLALSFYHTWGYDVRITRCTNNYGAYQFPEKFIPTIITRALRGETIPVFGDGLHVRDWIYVDDHCEGIFKVIEKGKAAHIYLFGGSSEKTNLELSRSILLTLAQKKGVSKDHFLRLISHVADRPGHDRRYAMDWTSSTAELGWKPRTSFSEGIERTVEWYVQNQTWWQSLI